MTILKKILKMLLGNLWRCWFFGVGIVLFLLNYPLLMLLLYNEKHFPAAFTIMRVNARLLFLLTGVWPRVSGAQYLDPAKAYVFCINHSSYIDIVTCYVAISRHFHMMGKAELQNVPLFNIFFKKMNIPVNRASITESHKAYQRACIDIDKNISIIIFPEATIPADAPRLGHFKNGAFKLAIEKKVPCVPVTFCTNHELMPDNVLYRKFGGRPGICRVVIHSPITTAQLTDRDVTALRNTVYQTIKSELPQAF